MLKGMTEDDGSKLKRMLDYSEEQDQLKDWLNGRGQTVIAVLIGIVVLWSGYWLVFG